MLVGLERPVSFFFDGESSSSSPVFLIVLLAFAVKFNPFPVLFGEPKVPYLVGDLPEIFKLLFFKVPLLYTVVGEFSAAISALLVARSLFYPLQQVKQHFSKS